MLLDWLKRGLTMHFVERGGVWEGVRYWGRDAKKKLSDDHKKGGK